VGCPHDAAVSLIGQPLHRIGTVRRLQGISRRTVARRLNVEVSQVKLQELATSDMLLSRLYEWQRALEVPVTELLVEPGESLSPPVLERAQLVRVMKTVLSILEEAEQEPIRRMAQTLVEQLVTMMPELASVSSWHAIGHRRRRDDLGVAAERRLSDDLFLDSMD
jgi:transcriptional regulator with XRE-family HTH domain